MSKHQELLELIASNNLELIEDNIPLETVKGFLMDKSIVINSRIRGTAERNCILAEEIGHYIANHGDIIDYNKCMYYELKGREKGYNLLINFDGLIKAYNYGCCNNYEFAEFLEVTEEYLLEWLNFMLAKHGDFITYENYIINFSNFWIEKID